METLKNLTLVQWIGIMIGLNSLLMGATPQLTVLFGTAAVPIIVAVATLGNGALGVFVTVIGGLGSQARNVVAGGASIAVGPNAPASLAILAMDPAQKKIDAEPGAGAAVAAIAKAAASVLFAIFAIGLMFAQSAQAQAPAPRRAPAPTADVTPASLPSYRSGAPFVLRLLNPLGLPDPMCITDHPTGNNCTSTEAGGGVKMTGSPDKDLADFLKRGGIALIRDMKRADQYLGYPCLVSSPPSGCVKTEPLGSACLEAIIPVGEMVVNGPPSPDGTTAPAPPTGTTAPAAAPPVADTTTVPTINSNDEGIITALAKQAIVFNALQSPSLVQGCGGFVFQKFKDAATIGAGVMQFVTTLGLTGV